MLYTGPSIYKKPPLPQFSSRLNKQQNIHIDNINQLTTVGWTTDTNQNINFFEFIEYMTQSYIT